MVGRVSDVPGPFQAGTCIEVIEHLTPRMVENLARDLAKCTVPGSIFLFNTGLTEFVKHEDPGYLDPDGRGHISIWSVTAARHIFSQYGFSVYPLRAKNWAFIVERNFPEQDIHSINMDERIWTHLKSNEAVLRDQVTTDVMYYLGMDAARAH